MVDGDGYIFVGGGGWWMVVGGGGYILAGGGQWWWVNGWWHSLAKPIIITAMLFAVIAITNYHQYYILVYTIFICKLSYYLQTFY